MNYAVFSSSVIFTLKGWMCASSLTKLSKPILPRDARGAVRGGDSIKPSMLVQIERAFNNGP